uniref:Putative peroxisomal sarcosine oxidase-like protein n=1 Tax=Pinctada fucata TaxID=50426 RepID=A0A194ANL0_PINFU
MQKQCPNTESKYERLTGSQLHEKYPQFETDDSYTALYEEKAGLVDAAMSISVQIQLARAHGASVIDNCPVRRIDKAPNGHIMVYTANGIYQCRRLLVTSGAWINNVLQSIGVHVPIYVTQEQVSYFATPHVKEFTKEKYPIWIYHGSDRDYYGLPSHGNSGSKCGIEMGGVVVTPETRTYIPDPVREKYVTDFLKETIPRSLGPIMYTKTCLYTMPKDRHFVVDHCGKMRPGWDNVIVCNGAGHCFKFSCLLGKILSEMAVDGKTQYDVSNFNIDRPAITQPGWTPEMYSETGGKVPVGAPTSKL